MAACRDHSHPAKPRLIDKVAVWACASTGEELRVIGSVPA